MTEAVAMAIPEEAKPALREKIATFQSDPDTLKEALGQKFKEFDADSNGALDRKEIRGFLKSFFEEFQIHLPLTDEYCDAIFRTLDEDRSNSIEVEELCTYATEFMNQLAKGL